MATVSAILKPLASNEGDHSNPDLSRKIPDSRVTSRVLHSKADWDWVGIIGTGQSLSVGARSTATSKEQPFGNLKLSTGSLPYPIDANNPILKLVPLTEPIGRMAPNYPSSWPENIDGETPHTAAANEISSLEIANKTGHFITVHSAVGEDGQGMIYLKKNAPHHGLNGRSYEGAMVETTAIARLAKAAGKRYGVGAIFITHGETDCGNQNYEDELYQLWTDYNADCKRITGQSQDLIMISSQQNALLDDSPSTIAQWKLTDDHSDAYVCACPKYQYPYFSDKLHLIAQGYQELGEKYGEVFFQRFVLGRKWKPLEPTRTMRQGSRIRVTFHVPNGPLKWDHSMDPPHATSKEWANGKGFELRNASGAPIAISSVSIEPDGKTVDIDCPDLIPAGTILSYAMVANPTERKLPEPGTVRWGLLCDSDPMVGTTTGKVQPNYCLAFRLVLN